MSKEKRKEGVDNKKNRPGIVLYIITVVFSVIFLFVGNKIATENLSVFGGRDSEEVVTARIEAITDRTSAHYSYDGNITLENIQLTFEAIILSGSEEGQRVTGIQTIGGVYSAGKPEAEKGDRVLLLKSPGSQEAEWQLVEFERTDKLIVIGVLFALALLVFGRLKGFNTILSLVFTCASIFAVFIPAILSGKNIYLASIVICVYTIIMTYLIINGGNKKTLAAALGCFGGIIVSGILTVMMNIFLGLTGYVSEESIYLTFLSTETPIDLKAIIFAAILIGAMGAIMDVAMSISSSLWEVKEKSHATFTSLVKSGMNIGRDVMGTMSNTLILAYIGSSLSVVLLLSAYNTSLLYLMNREMIVVEILQALVGSFGILFTMPLTSLICAAIYTRRKKQDFDAGENPQ